MPHAKKPALKPGNEIQPPLGIRVPPTYRPADSLEHLVADGENWQTLASRYRLAAADIIRSNYRVTKAEYVNWYLNHFVDCDTTTPDRYNWRFSTSARQGSSPRAGIVYVKPNWPLVQRAVRQVVREFIRNWFVRATFNGARVEGSTLLVDSGNLVGDRSALLSLLPGLQAAGLPDPLAKAVAAALEEGVQSYTEQFTCVHGNAFPPFDQWPGGVPALLPLPEPWTMLEHESPGDSALNAGRLGFEIRRRLSSDETAANAFIHPFTLWLEKEFKGFRSTSHAVDITGSGTARAKAGERGPVFGVATGAIGFLRPGVMRE